MGILASILVYERNLSPETSTNQVHQVMRYQKRIVLSEESRTKWLSQIEANDIENSSLVDNPRWTTNSYTICSVLST